MTNKMKAKSKISFFSNISDFTKLLIMALLITTVVVVFEIMSWIEDILNSEGKLKNE